MIELPRACFVAGEIARHAEFFSFGTNDLTQTALGFSRDDIEGRVVPHYADSGILERSPFAGSTRRASASWSGWRSSAAAAPARLEVGICGEHGGDPDSIRFCHAAGLDYVSCSPFRVPIARRGGRPRAELTGPPAQPGRSPVRHLLSACRLPTTTPPPAGARPRSRLAAEHLDHPVVVGVVSA